MSPAVPAPGSAVPPAPRMTLTVAAVARRLGVAPATLRTWDRRYGLGPSEHTAGAHRRYSSADLARLVVMRRLTLEGVAPAEAAQLAATTAVADGGFALASVSTIPAAVIEAAVTDAAAIAGPGSGLIPGLDAGLDAGLDVGLGDPAGAEGAGAAGADESEDAESRPLPEGPGPGDADWAVSSLADRFSEEVRGRGVAPAWDAVLSPALATRDAAMHAAVARTLAALPVATGERAVLLAGLHDPAAGAPRGPVLLAAAAALAAVGAGSRSVGEGVPVRVLAAAVRRARPPALLLHAATTPADGVVEDLAALARVRPAPLLVLVGEGWSPAVRDRLPGAEPASGLADAVARCVAAVTA
ncbi:MerR family transcriptional regulator [Kineococcus radiotolerans]|uniref:Transcriptional regulator, MerR family n=1 Tax=Kineococcus radiotolerans (strain ATCC BAA-149 / DSM 14245 / SRS30216) TaxID=266940 RepID=A6W5Y8_KINRD|nr:MerR family transcriptional regulator [Kineococcus radiotolerans]ABS02227.1 putative transcriptional regulator, MerR family [Kineococcus radiotolerans SRS30216 = ATCC BAA-149]